MTDDAANDAQADPDLDAIAETIKGKSFFEVRDILHGVNRLVHLYATSTEGGITAQGGQDQYNADLAALSYQQKIKTFLCSQLQEMQA